MSNWVHLSNYTKLLLKFEKWLVRSKKHIDTKYKVLNRNGGLEYL